MTFRAPLVTRKPFSLTAVVSSPERITFTSRIALLTNPAAFKTSRSIIAASSVAISLKLT